MKYVSSGEEIYRIRDTYLPVPAGHFILFRENVPYQAKSSDKAVSTEGMCLDLYSANLKSKEEEIYASPLLFDLPYPIWESAENGSFPINGTHTPDKLETLSSSLESFISQVIGMEAALGFHAKNMHTQRRLAVILMKADAYIRQHYREKIKLDTLAQWVGLSKFHLSRLFKDCLGYSPQEAQTRLRMEEARVLLLEPHTVTSIALELGYYDAAAFTNQFRKYHQISPRAFRLASS